MSTNLFYAPVKPRDGKSLANGLKFLLAPRYFDHDGSLSGEAILTETDIPFLEGIVAATGTNEIGRSAEELIDAIKKWGEVEISIRG